ncbi:MAG: U32 family peptidase [Oscillospiraceae bacterium]|nr:U32 family peptidase [Oscillospiraceae bacterium]
MLAPEILAPAGDLERITAAVLFGADAVYLAGKSFGMRASPDNFTHDGIINAVKLCHERGVKVYLTCNTLPTNEEAGRLPEFIRFAGDAGVDALIVADIGVLMAAKRMLPDMPVHISTQMGVVNYLLATELYNLGATRVILARELSLSDISVIRDKTPAGLALEAFVHGAMCMSFSGRCVISQYLTGRDPNRGQCAQPCRWAYHLMEEKREGLYFPVFEDEDGSYILNAQDLCMIGHIDKLCNAGISSFKIEGRAKSAYYVAAVTNAYKLAVEIYKQSPGDYKAPDWLLEEVRKVSHRQYSTGFFFGESNPGQYYESGGYVRDWDVAAVVTGYKNGLLTITERNRFSCGETFEILSPGKRPEPFAVTKILDEAGEDTETARHPMSVYKIPCEKEYPAGSIIRRKK